MNELTDDQARRDYKRYQFVDPKVGRFQVPNGNGLDRDGAIRRATREIEYHYHAYPKMTSGVAVLWLFIVIACFVSIIYLLFG